LSVISAPAGFGKSTLAVQWIDQLGLPTAWYSIDNEDNDPLRWIYYFVAAIHAAEPDFDVSILQKLNSTPVVPVESLLPELLNQITEFSQTVVLVLDDYHLIDNEEIHKILQRILTHQPAQLCLIIISRSELPLALSKLRAHHLVHEVSGDDLRFSLPEAVDLLTAVAGPGLSEEDAAILEKRTEGWAAGLQMAALSLRDSGDKRSFIQAFDSDDHYIMQYLSEEVLSHQTQDVKNFLLRTSVLDRFNGPLCDTVTGMDNCTEYLIRLERTNMFLISLDNKRCWYRYHHLFSELLHNQLLRTQPGLSAQLYLNASKWFDENGYPHDAMRYAFEYAAASGHDHEAYKQAVGILDQNAMKLILQGHSPVILEWFKKIPEKYIYSDPIRMLTYLWIVFIVCGEVAESEIRKIAQKIQTGEIEKNMTKPINGALLFLRAYTAMQQREVDLALKLGWQSLKEFPEIMGPKMLIATGLYVKGRVKVAEKNYRDVIRDSLAQKYPVVLSASITGLGLTLMKQGRLDEASNSILAITGELKKLDLYEMLQDRSALNLVLGEIAYKQNRLDSALEYLHQAEREAKQGIFAGSFEEIRRTADTLRAVIHWQRGNHEVAQKILEDFSDQNIAPNKLPLYPPLPLVVARWQIIMGNTKPAEEWITNRKVSFNDDFDESRENEYLLLARLLVAQQSPEMVIPLTSKLIMSAEQEGRVDTILESLVLQALALQLQDKREQAVECLQRALEIAETYGYVRIFLDERKPMEALLRDATKRGKNILYAKNLVAQIQSSDNDAATTLTNSAISNIELLSKTEIRLLKLLVKGLSNKEISRQMKISDNTVKSHLRNIYRKLKVNSRSRAILVAIEMGF
jgi:LuxR family transcriptional regulator, maltose regulon positive regulatory protein